MEQKKVDRINELTRLSRERELTAEEQSERQALRQEYLSEWKQGAENTLSNIVIVEPDGTKHKIKKRR